MDEGELKGYRVRVTVDYPIWQYSKEVALETAKDIAAYSHSASLVIDAKIIKVGKPDNRELFGDSS